jgi:hypothetical protein
LSQDKNEIGDDGSKEEADRERIRVCFEMIDDDNSGTLDQVIFISPSPHPNPCSPIVSFCAFTFVHHHYCVRMTGNLTI